LRRTNGPCGLPSATVCLSTTRSSSRQPCWRSARHFTRKICRTAK